MQIGERIQGQYQIKHVLGQGSMGTTYKALDLATGRPVAIKQLHLSRIQGWKALEMFERESKILKHVSHPRVPSYIDYFSQDTKDGKQFLLVQEYVKGKTLKQLVEGGWRGTEQEILDIFTDLVDILTALHTLRPPVIHRDINPKNIIISPNHEVYPRLHEVYLVDFGAVQDQMRTTFLEGSTVIGTFGYMPFEQFSGQTVPASDYYALGATLLYMLTHRHPSDFPAEELKPQFEPFLHGSNCMLRLLQGLLEPSAKNRISSPEAIQQILEEYGPDDLDFSANRLKPKSTRIEKHVDGPYDLSFRIPARKVGLVVKRNVLRLSPEHVQAHEEMLGIRSGELWRIPTADLQGSDLTWYFSNGNGSKKHHSVLGINYGGETFKIADRLQKDEIHWLSREIDEYVWNVQHNIHQERPLSDLPNGNGAQPVSAAERPKVSRPSGSLIKKSSKAEEQIRYRIPKTLRKQEFFDFLLTALMSLAGASLMSVTALFIIYKSGGIGWIPGGLLLAFAAIFGGLGLGLLVSVFSRSFGTTILQLTPEWIRISRRFLGLGYSRDLPTASLTQNDVVRYFHKNRLLLGLNHAQKTLVIGSGLTLDESEWLIQEITDYIAQFAREIPEPMTNLGLEMK